MKITISPYKRITEKYAKRIEEKTKTSLNKVVEYATRQAQNSFDRFVIEVPADDPYVWVKNTPLIKAKDTYSRSISATGNQVLFIEFGAGKTFYTDTATRFFKGIMPNDRPKGIYDIGHYINPERAKTMTAQQIASYESRGKDDVWFYKSQTGRESENAHWVKNNRNNEPIMITRGNRPARAMYLAVGMAIRRLLGGRLK